MGLNFIDLNMETLNYNVKKFKQRYKNITSKKLKLIVSKIEFQKFNPIFKQIG
jgi:hypothetical protein